MSPICGSWTGRLSAEPRSSGSRTSTTSTLTWAAEWAVLREMFSCRRAGRPRGLWPQTYRRPCCSSHDRIVYDHLDIDSAVEASAFVAKYGQFARVYSFLCFHLVSDETASFRNIWRLLSTDGECLVTACVTNPALDAWLDVHRMPEWRNLVPDPRAVLPSSSVHFHCTGAEAQIEGETRQCVINAGLECIACVVLQCPWLAPDIGHFCDIYTDCFLVDANVPPMAFKEVYIERLRPRVKQTPCGWETSVGIYRVHARSLSPAPAVPDAAA
ncbi:uncharacterized protein LOC144129526 [Amblyomma americanum]